MSKVNQINFDNEAAEGMPGILLQPMKFGQHRAEGYRQSDAPSLRQMMIAENTVKRDQAEFNGTMRVPVVI